MVYAVYSAIVVTFDGTRRACTRMLDSAALSFSAEPTDPHLACCLAWDSEIQQVFLGHLDFGSQRPNQVVALMLSLVVFLESYTLPGSFFFHNGSDGST